MDIRIFSKPDDFGLDKRRAVGIVGELKSIYRRKALLVMMRMGRGNVLVCEGRVLTSEMTEKRLDPR